MYSIGHGADVVVPLGPQLR